MLETKIRSRIMNAIEEVIGTDRGEPHTVPIWSNEQPREEWPQTEFLIMRTTDSGGYREKSQSRA